MESKRKDVFISCMVNNIYKEFQLDAKTLEDLNAYLKTAMLKDKETILHLKKAKFLRTIASGSYLNLEEFYDPEDEAFDKFLKVVLSKLVLKPVFEMNKEDLEEWFYFMGRYARSGRTEEYRRQDELFSNGLKNAAYLKKLEIDVIENHFMIREKPKTTEIIKNQNIKQYTKKKEKRA